MIRLLFKVFVFIFVTGAAVAAESPPIPVMSQTHLWDKEPALWDEARKFQLVQPVPAVLGEQESLGMGVNISNERLQSSLWGKPDRFVLSLGKADVWNRAKLNPFSGKKPVGQIQILSDDFAGAAQPDVRTSIHDGNNVFCVTQGVASATYQVLLTPSDLNVVAIKAVCSKLGKPMSVRLYRHRDKNKDLPEPQGGSDGAFFWIHQQFLAEKTFPDGFDYYLVAKVAGATGAVDVANMKAGLGAPVMFRPDEAPGSAATLSIKPGDARDLVIYATVVTRAESADPLAEARRRLESAEKRGYAGLLEMKAAWCRSLYERRERGRIFTGDFDDARRVALPFFYQGSYQSRHIGFSNPDPAKYESDAAYNQLENDEVRWCGLLCFNEELYTGDFVAGRDESVTAYYPAVFKMYRTVYEGYAKERGFEGLLVLRGYVPPIKMDKYWSPDYPANDRNECDWASLVWAFKNVWDEYDYGGKDDGFLKDKVYPSLRGIADFFASLVKSGADGFYHIEPSQIREEDIGRDAVDCIAAAKWAFKRAIEVSERLGVDEAKRRVWAERLGKMAPYYIIENEGKEKVFASLVKNGVPVVASHGTTHFIVNVADEINLDSPEDEKQMAIRSNLHAHGQPMNRQVEFLLGKQPDTLCMTSVFGNPPWLIHYAQKSGTGDYSKMLPLETRAQKAIACWLEPERLCNSRSGTIHFFPCVPGNFDVAFKDFQARGGFLVTSELKSGMVTYARIRARRDGDCKVMNPWPGKNMIVSELPGRNPVLFKKDGERYSFSTKTGREYKLSFLE